MWIEKVNIISDSVRKKRRAFPETGKAFCFPGHFFLGDYVALRDRFPHFPQYPQSLGSPVFTGVSADLGISFLQKVCYTQSYENDSAKNNMKNGAE